MMNGVHPFSVVVFRMVLKTTREAGSAVTRATRRGLQQSSEMLKRARKAAEAKRLREPCHILSHRLTLLSSSARVERLLTRVRFKA